MSQGKLLRLPLFPLDHLSGISVVDDHISVTNTCVEMSDLTNKEKVYLIECFYSRGKVYVNAYRGFRTKFGQHKVASENTLKRY